MMDEPQTPFQPPTDFQSWQLSRKLSQRDFLIGRMESLLDLMIYFCPQEAVSLHNSYQKIKAELSEMYDHD